MSPRSTSGRAPRRLVLLVPVLLIALVGAAVTFAAVAPRYRATGTALLTAPRAQVGDNGITVNPYGDLGAATTRLATLVAAVGGGDAVHAAVTAAGGHSSYSVTADLRTPLLTVSATGTSAADAVRTSDLVLADLGHRFVALQSGSGVPAAQQFTLRAVTTATSASTLIWRRILISLAVLAALLLVGVAVAVALGRRAARTPVPVLPRRPLRDRLPRREPAAIRRPVQLGGHAGDLSSVAPAVGHRWEAPLDDTFAEGGRLPLLIPGEDDQQLDDLLDDALTEATAVVPRNYLTRPPTTRVPSPADAVAEPAVIEPAVSTTAADPAEAAAPAAKPARPRGSRRVSAIGYEGRAEPLPAETVFLAPDGPGPLEADAAVTGPAGPAHERTTGIDAAATADPLGAPDADAAPASVPEIAVHPLGGALLTVKEPPEVVLPVEAPVEVAEPVVVLPASDPEPIPAQAEEAVVLPEPVPAPKVRALRGQQPQARHRSESPSARTRRRPASGSSGPASASASTSEDKAVGPKTPRASRAKPASSPNGTGTPTPGAVASRARRADTATRDE